MILTKYKTASKYLLVFNYLVRIEMVTKHYPLQEWIFLSFTRMGVVF